MAEVKPHPLPYTKVICLVCAGLMAGWFARAISRSQRCGSTYFKQCIQSLVKRSVRHPKTTLIVAQVSLPLLSPDHWDTEIFRPLTIKTRNNHLKLMRVTLHW